MKKIIVSTLVLGLCMAMTFAIGKSESSGGFDGEVTASGSSALLPLAQLGAENFMEKYPNSNISITGGGSGTGLKQVAAMEVTIGNSDLFAEEKLDASQAADLKDHRVCTVTMAPIVNKESGITNLTQNQLIDIFTGKVTNWKEVGGPDLRIMLITRPTSSGTRALFTQYGLNGNEEIMGAMENDNSGELLTAVSQNKGAIGYIALSYLLNNPNVQPVSVDGIAPTLENIYSGDYLIWGYEHMYTNTKAEINETAEAFLAYMMSAEFAPYIEQLGYGASSKLSEKAINSHN
ncbi:MAG: phosphate ABC transporter substrate-binding protein [Spirochaetales bacterium]